MENIRPGTFKNGYWVWDDYSNGLQFISRDAGANKILQSVTNVNAAAAKTSAKRSTHEMKFREAVDQLEQVRFRRYHQRRCRPREPCVITVQDIKDIVLFIADIKQLTPEFISYFHLPTMDRFLRALIVYFQYYFQVWEGIQARREEAKRKLYQPVVTKLENIVRDDLSDLRAMVAREYCCIIVGAQDALKFHHMNNENHSSLSDKDRRLFEMLMCMVVRVVWIALQRKNLSLIELELNKLLRTDIFNLISHRGIRGGADLFRTKAEEKVLQGKANTEERKLLHHSCIAKELLIGDHDYRLLIIGIKAYQPTDERLTYLEMAISAPEELLLTNGITVGMLGLPRDDYDAMLMNLQHSAKKKLALQPRILPEFKLPPRKRYSDSEMSNTFPKNRPKYTETQQTKKARKTQCKMWRKAVERGPDGREMSILDLSLTQSHMLLLTSRSSISMATKIPPSES